MLNKVSSEDIQTPSIAKITDASLPHFVAYGNNKTADDEVHEILSKHYHAATAITFV